MIEEPCTLADLDAGYNITSYFGVNADGSADFSDGREESEPEWDKEVDEYHCRNCDEFIFDKDEVLKHIAGQAAEL